ncbi:MAG: hypothetical protein H7Y17_12220 [Chlorobia bacterium]|nr:hypothetical protein [Fimbriimonadaceae bacterium]
MANIMLTKDQWDALQRHLLPNPFKVEEAAFLFVKVTESGDFECVDSWCMQPHDFDYQSAFHISLRDETKAAVIKRAHDTGTALVEAHSHLGKWPAEFSRSDLCGFDSFVPHVRWRLKGKPYAAIVLTTADYDGFAWIGDATDPVRIDGLVIGDVDRLGPTGLTPLTWGPWEDFDGHI